MSTDSQEHSTYLSEADRETAFFDQLGRSGAGAQGVHLARELLSWIRPQVDRIFWGRGELEPNLQKGVAKSRVFVVVPRGAVVLKFDYLFSRHPFIAPLKRKELLRRLNEALNPVTFSEKGNNRFMLGVLSDPEKMRTFRLTIEWALRELQAESSA